MARTRKRHVQQDLRYPDKNGQWRGGKRRGAGRPKSGVFASQPHKVRERLKANEPVQVTVRAVKEMHQLRRLDAYQAVRKAMVATFTREDFRIVHLSIQGTHIHLLIETDDRMALARGKTLVFENLPANLLALATLYGVAELIQPES